MNFIMTFIIACTFVLGIMLFNGSSNIDISSNTKLGSQWEQAVKQKKPVVAYFYVDWCGTCRYFNPVMRQISQEYGSKYTFMFINAEDPNYDSMTRAFKVRSYPTIYLVDPKADKSYKLPLYDDTNMLKKELDSFLSGN